MRYFSWKLLILLTIALITTTTDLEAKDKGDQLPKLELSPKGFSIRSAQYTVKVIIPFATPELYCPEVVIKVAESSNPGDYLYKHSEESDCPPWEEDMRGKRITFTHVIANRLGFGKWLILVEISQNGRTWRLNQEVHIGGINDE